MVLQIFVQFAGTLSERVFFEFEHFSFLFCFLFCFIEKFQSSLNFESSLRFFSVEFSAEFYFSWIFMVELQ